MTWLVILVATIIIPPLALRASAWYLRRGSFNRD
jgi:hypothetical protein